MNYPNVDLLDQVLERVHKLAEIVDNDYRGNKGTAINAGCDVWDQGIRLRLNKTSTCGTYGCFAGWTVMLAGYPEAGPDNIEDQARELLGLNSWEAAMLFEASNRLSDLDFYVQRIKDGVYR